MHTNICRPRNSCVASCDTHPLSRTNFANALHRPERVYRGGHPNEQCPREWSGVGLEGHKTLEKPPYSCGTGVACDLFSMLETSASMAVFNTSGKLMSRTDRFAREFPKSQLPRLKREAMSLLRSKRHRRSIQIDDRQIVLQRLRGEEPCVVVTALPDIFRRLSPRQQQIARLATDGATSVEIAQILDISVHTVRQHIKEIYRRLEVGNRAELVHIVTTSSKRLNLLPRRMSR